MPGKSKHGKGRRNQFRKPRQAQATAPAASSSATTAMSAASVQPEAKPVNKPVSQAKPQTGKVAAAAEYPYISGELKKIAIITGIIVVIMVILTFVLK